MTDWQVKPLSRRCAVSGEPLLPGDRVACVVVKPLGRDIERVDIAENRLPDYAPDGLVLGRWTRVIKDKPDEEDREARARLLASREEFFLSLYDSPDDPDGDKAVLKQLIGLLLERRRILKPAAPATGGVQRYKHTRSGADYAVPTDDLSPAQVARVQFTLEALIT